MISTYGSGVENWAKALRALGLEQSVILSDQANAGQAMLEAVRLRLAGQQFLFGPLVESGRAAVAMQVAASVFEIESTLRRTYLDRVTNGSLVVNGAPIVTVSTHDPHRIATLRSIAALAHGLIFRSRTESDAFRRIVVDVGTPVSVVPGNPIGPGIQHGPRDALVIYGPSEPLERLMLIAIALVDLQIPITIVAADPRPLSNFAATVVGPDAAPAALGRAKVIVEGSYSDPLPCLALGECEPPFALASTTGSSEYRPGAPMFEPWSRSSIVDAVLRAIGQGPTRVFAPAQFRPAVQPIATTQGPLVSIVIVTYNRRDFLVRAVASARAQTYQNTEIIVVNDGTEPVADLFTDMPDVKVVNNPVNLGLGGTRNAGVAVASGEYVAFLDDDDEYFPDHVAILTEALERSGLDMANAASITRFARKSGSEFRVRGYLVESMRSFAWNELLITNAAPPLTVMVRRSAFQRVGGFPEDRTGLEDYGLWLKLSKIGDVAFVMRVTCIYSRRDDGSNMIVYTGPKHAEYLESIYQAYPADGRELVLEERQRTLALVREIGAPPVPIPPIEMDEPLPDPPRRSA